MCLHTNKLLVISAVIILKVMGIAALILVCFRYQGGMTAVCMCAVSANWIQNTVQHYLIFKGKAEARSSPSFDFHLEEEKNREKSEGGGNQTVELCYCIIYFH